MEKVKGLTMVVSLFGLISLWLPSPSSASPSVKVTGVLKGYFLSPDGTLKVREIPFAFPKRPKSNSSPFQLFPVWAHYYLQMRVESPDVPIRRLKLQVGEQERMITLEKPQKSISIPEGSPQWLTIHARLGLTLKVTVELADGTAVTAQPQYAVQLGGVQRLKIDWRDLERIAKIGEFLRQRGDEILPGLRADHVPVLLEGEEGQWVLVGGKFPDRWRYNGIAPFGLTVYLPPFRFRVPPEIKEQVLGGVLRTRDMGIVVILHYQPGWDTLEELDKPQSGRHGERTFALVHEIVHYWFGQKFGWAKTPQPVSYTDWEGYLAWKLEGNALSQALSAESESARMEAVKDFLRFRWYRYCLGCGDAKTEGQEEWDEGVANFLSEKVLELGGDQLGVPLTYIPSLFFLDLEPFEQPTPTLELPFEPLSQARHLGYVQAKLLDKMMPNWIRLIREQRLPLDELLAKAVGLEKDKVLALSLKQMRDEIRLEAQKAGWVKEPSLKEGNELVVLVPLPHGEGTNLHWLAFEKCEVTFEDGHVKSDKEVSIAWSEKGIAFRWVSSSPFVLRAKQEKRDSKVVLEGEGIRVEVGQGEVWKTPRGIVVGRKDQAKVWALAHARKPEEVSPIMLSTAWTILTLGAVAAFGAGVAQAQGLQVAGFVSGRFLNTWTNTVEYHTIEFVPDLELSDYSLLEPLDDEEYEVTIQVNDPDAQLTRLSLLLTDGTSISVTSDQPTNQLTLTYRGEWDKIFRPIGELIEWIGKTLIEVAKQTGAAYLAEYLKKLLQGKKKGTLAIHVRICDAEQTQSPTGFAQVTLEVWRGNKRVVPSPDASWIVSPDGNGDLSLQLPKAPDYLVRALKFISIPACPEVWNGPYAVFENQTTHAQLLFYYHKGIKGRVIEQTSSGSTALPGAKAYLYKGTQELVGPWESGSDGYFFIPPFPLDGILMQYGSGTYTVKVVPPHRSMLRPEPLEGVKDVSLMKCERKKPGDNCPRSLTIDVGTFYFTYKPTFPGGPGGGG
jgi:hypothetical protein